MILSLMKSLPLFPKPFFALCLSSLLLFGQVAPLVAAQGQNSGIKWLRSNDRSQSEKGRQATGNHAAAAPENRFVNAPIAKPAPETLAWLAPSITATKTDSFADSDGDLKAEPGEVITYNITIANGGPDAGTGVQFSDAGDPNTSLVPGSVQTQPLAFPDNATAFGNVRITTANGAVNLLANDCDPDDVTGPCNDNLTASGPATSTQNGNVLVNADGTFEYDPFPGFTGSDTFTYTIRDKGPDNIANNSDDKTDTATVTITVGPTLIWFINNNAAPGGNGRLTSPFNSIAAFNAGAADDPGDIVFLFTGTGTYYGGITLLNTQKLIGQGFLLATETGAPPAGSDTFPALGSAPAIDNPGANIITLGQNNTLRGFNTGNSGAAGSDISGTSFGTVTISNLSINGDGRALNLTTGTLAATVAGLSASNTGSNDGVTLNAVGGSLTVSGTTSITNPGGDGIDISNGPAATSYNFGTATISKNAAGAAVNLGTNNAGTTTSFTSLTASNSSGAGIVTNSSGTLNATTGSITTTGTGVAASFTNTALGLTFTSVSSNGGANGLVFSGGTGSFTSGTTNLQNNAGIGLLMSNSAVAANFGNMTVNSSAGDAVDLSSNTGAITFADLDMTPDAGLRGLDAQNNTGTITATSGDITTSGGGTASAVFVDGPAGRTPINLTFTSVTTSGVGSGTASVSIVDAMGTKFQVTGTTQINTRSGRGVFVDNTTATTIQFATVNIPNPSNAGGNAFHVEDSSSAVTVATVDIDDPFVTTLQTDPETDFFPNTDGDGDGIFLRGNSGLFTLSGGTISNPGNDGIDARATRIAITGVTITNPGQDTGGSSEGFGGHGIFAINLSGANTITSTTISGFNGANRSGLVVNSNTGTATLTVTSSTFQNSTGNTGATSLVAGTGNVTLTIGQPAAGCTFSNISASAIVFRSAGTGVLNNTIQNSTFQNAPVNGKTNVTGGVSNDATGNFTIINNTFNNVGRTASTGEALISFVGGGTGVPGTPIFGMNVSGNTISGVGQNSTACGAGATYCAGPISAILVFVDGGADVNGTVQINNNIISNVQGGGIKFDMANDAGGHIDARITGNTVGTDAAPVGLGGNNVSNQSGIIVERRRLGAETANVLISGNTIRNGSAGFSSTINGNGIWVRGQADTNLSTTIINNNINTLSTGGPTEMRVEANTVAVGEADAAIVCADIGGNGSVGQANTVAGGTGTIVLNEATGNTLNIEQASAAALATANGIPAGNVQINAGSPSFGVSCATPPAAFNMLKPETREYVASAIPTEQNSNATTKLSATTSTQVSQLSLTTLADNAVRSLTSDVSSLITSATPASNPSAPIEIKSDVRTHNSVSGARNQTSEVHVEAADARANHAKADKVETRRPESDNRAHHATAIQTVAAPVGTGVGISNFNIGTLPAGDSVTITFQVTVDNPPNTSQVSNQGTVSGTNFANVLTDDPSVAGASNPTVTPIDLFDSQTTLVSNLNPSNFGDSVAFTATVAIHPSQVPTPPSPLTPTGTVTFKDGGVDIAGCVSVALNGSAQAQCTTSALPAGSRNITAVYSGNSNYDGSTSNVVAQTVVACLANPIVTSTADDGSAGTLRHAITNACTGTSITFNIAGGGPHTIALGGSGELLIQKNLTITGPTNKSVIVSGGSNRAFRLAMGTVSISNLTISDSDPTGASGGGLRVEGATTFVTLVGMTFTGNSATGGFGGAISSSDVGAVLNVINTTVSGNAANAGGGLHNDGATVNLINVTVTNNDANAGTLTPGAGQGGGIYSQSGTTNVRNSIITGNLGQVTFENVVGTINSQGNNLLAGNAELGALANNGGPTRTHALLAGSPALDAGDNCVLTAGGCGAGDPVVALTNDQRGFDRSADAADTNTSDTVDIGAFEAQASVAVFADASIAQNSSHTVTDFSIGDSDYTLTVTAISDNPTLVPNHPTNLAISAGSSADKPTLVVTPATGQSGTANITITVTDTASGTSMSDTFLLTVTFVDTTAPVVSSIVRANANPSSAASVDFTVTFSENVTGVESTDFTLTTTGVSGASVTTVTPINAMQYTVTVNTGTGDGTIRLDVTDDDSIADIAGNILGGAGAQNFTTGEIYTVDKSAPTVDITDVTPDPRNTAVSSITIVFSEAVTGFDLADLSLTLNAGPNLLTGAQTLSSGDNITWTLGNLSGITAAQGTYVLTLTAAGSAITDGGGNPLAGDAIDSWVVDTTAPTVTINQAAGQSDPTSSSPINFTVVFSEPVTGFDNTDVTFSGAGATTAVVTEIAPNDGTTYNVAISGMNADGTVQASVNANAAQDGVGNNSVASTSTDNTVTFINAITININDAKVSEPASPNTVDMTFTVSLSTPAPAGGVNVNFTTNNGSATAGTCGNPGADYVLTSGTVNFAVGQQVKTINVPVCSDNVSDDNETFTVTLSGPTAPGVLGDSTATSTITGNVAGAVVISELRTSGPAGAGDDFVEIYNNSNSPLTVAASDISAGYGLYKMGADCNAAPILIGIIPNGTVIPARGHYLFVGSVYSLGNYGGSGAAAGNLTFSSDLDSDANVGLFTTSDVTAISSANRLDAVGFGINTGGACNLLREASTLPTMAGSTLEHSYFRKMCEWISGSGCTVPGIPKDTNNNLADFWLADTTGSAITGRLGAPGPENLASPIRRDNANNPGGGGIDVFLLDGTVGSSAAPNRDRNASDPAGTFGSMTLRYRVTNNTGAPVTRLRYRIVDISTAIQPAGPVADLRALTGIGEPAVGPVNDSVTCTAGGAGAPPCTVTVTATTLETPPNQPIGGGYNSSLSSGTITTGTPLNNGNSILLNFKLGVEKTGQFRFYIIVEALP